MCYLSYSFLMLLIAVGIYRVNKLFCHMLILLLLFFFKQKRAYEMRISDWSSDVCSSDLLPVVRHPRARQARGHAGCRHWPSRIAPRWTIRGFPPAHPTRRQIRPMHYLMLSRAEPPPSEWPMRELQSLAARSNHPSTGAYRPAASSRAVAGSVP